jgi:hypothetical protein
MSSKVNSVHLPTAKEFKNNTLVMLRTILLTTQALEQLPGECEATRWRAKARPPIPSVASLPT